MSMCRQFIPVVSILLLAALSPCPARAMTLTVYPCTESQLDRALSGAGDGDTVRFGCSATITVTATKLLLKRIIIDGSGQSVTISNAGTIPVFRIDVVATVTITHLTVTHSRAESSGAIDNRGTLAVIDTDFFDTERGLYNGRGAMLTVTGSAFANNNIGIVNFGAATVTASTFTGNRRDGLYNRGKLMVLGCTFTGDSHGIDNDHGSLVVANSTFAGNRAPQPAGHGGGIANSGPSTVINSTFTGNQAPGGGSAIFTHEGGVVTLQNTIVAGGASGNCLGPIIDGGHNLQFPGTSCGNRIPSVDPGVLPLADNGGPTQTAALSPESPAIGAGDPTVCLASPVDNVDQRGAPRIAGGETRCDIGAFEMGGAPPTGGELLKYHPMRNNIYHLIPVLCGRMGGKLIQNLSILQ
jgi:fibronectin-binding autotransporter adhesin